MLNFRKLRQDISSNVLKEGKELFDDDAVRSAKILHLDGDTLRVGAQVIGQYENTYSPEIEIDRLESELIDSDCDCPYQFDCQHIAAVLFYLEKHLDEILVSYSKETDLDELTGEHGLEDDEKEQLIEAVKQAEAKEEKRRDEQFRREILEEYCVASKQLSKSPFFLPHEEKEIVRCDASFIFSSIQSDKPFVEFQIALRLPSRSKPLFVPNLRQFFEAYRYVEPLHMSGKRYFFSRESFSEIEGTFLEHVMSRAALVDVNAPDRAQKVGRLDIKAFGVLLAKAFEYGYGRLKKDGKAFQSDEPSPLPSLYSDGFENPLSFSLSNAQFSVGIEYLEPPTSKVLLNPQIEVEGDVIQLEEVLFFDCETPGLLYQSTYYSFTKGISRNHLRAISRLREMTVPEPLFGSFVENAIPELSRYAKLRNTEVLESISTLPFVNEVKGVCDLTYLNGELEARLCFRYGDKNIPASQKALSYEDIESFVSDEGVLARNLVAEEQLIEELFQGFIYQSDQEHYVAKTERKVIDFMTEVIPRFQESVEFNCPQNLLDQFIYDETSYTLTLSHTSRMDVYKIKMEVNGPLRGVSMDRLWDCVVSRRPYVELESTRSSIGNKIPKILVLDLQQTSQIVQLFDELGITMLKNHTLERPLWSLANIDGSQCEGLPITFSMTKQLMDIRKQMLGEKHFEFSDIPEVVNASLREYQVEGVHWLERLRLMYLNGILADDMGLGKTLQAIVALTQHVGPDKPPALVVCPTSLLYNWKEELHKFNSLLTTLVVDGMPHQRKKLIDSVLDYNVVITSYSLLQKDVELYCDIRFSYMVLDEAQHIKNRGTRNARSVKQVNAAHKLILSGTPIENSLDELWSLFDFLMPGFLSSYDRFVEKYVRSSGNEHTSNLEYLRKKVSPFILRRMKTDVLKDLPPVSEITYRCQLSPMQQELYTSYAQSARDELVRLVERDGFDKVQIHVLATLTRLKQICCHPAIFAKENPETGDSAKYDMLLELLQTLVEGGHKTVIFSQYTKMLQIMREDFERLGIRFNYLDGSSKNRLELVKQFNEDKSLSVFLVSLKAGGTGLNLVGADTVIHYDMWWNPAVENQATDRVHRLGQDQKVSVYKLVTLGTIEEKIVEMQNRKRGIVKKIVSSDDDVLTKLTWEDVLELLQT